RFENHATERCWSADSRFAWLCSRRERVIRGGLYVWHGMYAPKGTPKAVVDRLGTALREALKDPNVKARFAELGTEPVPAEKATPEGLRTHLKAEIDKWGPIYKKAGAYAD
ncbi:tripartite-type tricarboxylate transporter receptor subunit TctC, partial [Massilia sp. UYP11]|uniref:tripartite tricarboxylate transporter substrate-binding protein n=1 Tax=Massilia sp. UYP11 TaxID=1756385 RepID=UPI003D1A6CA7